MVAALIVLSTTICALLALVVWLVEKLDNVSRHGHLRAQMLVDQFSKQMLELSQGAMGHIKAKSLEDKVVNDARKAEYDSRVEYMRDQMAKTYEEQNAISKSPVPRKVVDLNSGREVDLNDVELFS